MTRAARVPASPPGDTPAPPDAALELPAGTPVEGAQQTIPGTAPKRGRGRPRGSGKSAPTAPGADRPPKTRAVGRPTVAAKLEVALGAELAAVAKVVGVVSPVDGVTILSHAPDVAEAFARLAEQNPRVKKLLTAGTTGSAWLGVVVAVGAMGLELAGNHGIGLFAPPPPSSPADAPSPVDFAGLSNLNDQAARRAAAANGAG